MSFLGLGASKPSSAEKLQIWESEIYAVTDQQERLNRVCIAKCVSDQHEAQLNKGESVCLDRCAVKFFETLKMVTNTMRDTQASNTAQAPSAERSSLF